MSQAYDKLTKQTAEADIRHASGQYLRIHPHIEFGGGDDSVFEKLRGLREVDFKRSSDPEALHTGGWISLEMAAHLQQNGYNPHHLLMEAEQLFIKSIQETQEHSTDSVNLTMAYRSKMALIAIYSELAQPASAAANNANLYSALLDDLMNDMVLKERDSSSHTGLISELGFATLASMQGFVIVSAGDRHDNPLSILQPRHAYDFRTWLETPGSIFDKPDRRIQVKTSSRKDTHTYASHITLACAVDGFAQDFQYLNSMSAALINHFKGEPVRSARAMWSAARRVGQLIEQPVEKEHNSYFRGGQMRSGKGFDTPDVTYKQAWKH